MKFSKNALGILTFWMVALLITPPIKTQTKPLKQPKNNVRVFSADRFVSKSFNSHDKVYKHDGLTAITSINDED